MKTSKKSLWIWIIFYFILKCNNNNLTRPFHGSKPREKNKVTSSFSGFPCDLPYNILRVTAYVDNTLAAVRPQSMLLIWKLLFNHIQGILVVAAGVSVCSILCQTSIWCISLCITWSTAWAMWSCLAQWSGQHMTQSQFHFGLGWRHKSDISKPR